MNILFYCNCIVSEPAAGGIIRVSGVLSKIFSEKGHDCFLAYYFDQMNGRPAPFADTVKLSKGCESKVLESFIQKNSIDVILLQVPLNNSNWHILDVLSEIKTRFPNVKTIHCIHQQPFAEVYGFDWSYLGFLLKWKSDKSFKEILWGITVLMFPSYAVKRTARRYQRISDGVDNVVLLSGNSIPFYQKHVRCRAGSLVGINNPVVYNMETIEVNRTKEKRLLFVGRLHEPTKRLSILLKIWKEVSGQFPDWQLDIVGDGIDASYYKHLCKRLKLANINFYGIQNPKEYYDKASIILNTSPAEGFVMALVEGMQNGLVPFTFDSYDAVTDLIDNGENGVIIKYKDIKTYAKQLSLLMSDSGRLNFMAEKAKEKVNDFNQDAIYEKWKEVLCP